MRHAFTVWDQGERVVAGQHLMQRSDMNAATMTGYGRMCGWTLARAYARTGDRITIATYLGPAQLILLRC
jgi:hypothetical protein